MGGAAGRSGARKRVTVQLHVFVFELQLTCGCVCEQVLSHRETVSGDMGRKQHNGFDVRCLSSQAAPLRSRLSSARSGYSGDPHRDARLPEAQRFSSIRFFGARGEWRSARNAEQLQGEGKTKSARREEKSAAAAVQGLRRTHNTRTHTCTHRQEVGQYAGGRRGGNAAVNRKNDNRPNRLRCEDAQSGDRRRKKKVVVGARTTSLKKCGSQAPRKWYIESGVLK